MASNALALIALRSPSEISMICMVPSLDKTVLSAVSVYIRFDEMAEGLLWRVNRAGMIAVEVTLSETVKVNSPSLRSSVKLVMRGRVVSGV